MNKKSIRMLVMADLNRQMLEEALPDICIDFCGYSDNFIVLEPNEIQSIIPEYDILISEFETIDKSVIDCAKKLKMIICCRAGVNTVVDVQYASARNIIVKNTPGRNATAVAEYVIGQIINSDRYLTYSNNMIQSGQLQAKQFIKPHKYKDSLWGMDKDSPYHVYRGKGLQNILLGIVGYGRVGRIVHEKAIAMGMKVQVYDPDISEVLPEVTWVDFNSLLRTSDIISLHCTNKNHTVLFTGDEFKKMKSDSFFINTARGDLVDEDALIENLINGHLRGAVLDVTKEEPLSVASKLINIDNLLLTPHIAGATDIVIDNGTKMVISYIREYLETIDDK